MKEVALPFLPETLEQIRARLTLALQETVSSEAIESGATRPGQNRRNVFDFESGLRMVVSIDRDDGRKGTGDLVLHVSFSATVEYMDSLLLGGHNHMQCARVFLTQSRSWFTELFVTGMGYHNQVHERETTGAIHFLVKVKKAQTSAANN